MRSIFLGLACLVLAGCSNEASTTIASNYSEKPVSDTTNRFFERVEASASFEPLWVPQGDFGELASSSQVVFTGRIVGLKNSVLVKGPSDGMRQAGINMRTIYDGIVFEVEEVVSGTLLDSGDVAVLAQPVLLERPGSDFMPLEVLHHEPIDLMKSGILAVEQDRKSPLYVVFAQSITIDGNTMLGFNGPGAVAEIDQESGIIQETGVPPFIWLSPGANGTGAPFTVDSLRKWIKDGPPLVSVPEEYWPDPLTDPQVREPFENDVPEGSDPTQPTPIETDPDYIKANGDR